MPSFDLTPEFAGRMQDALLRHNIGEETRVAVDDLVFSQRSLSTPKLLSFADGSTWQKLPIGVYFKGKCYILDGNHRCMVCVLRGDKEVSLWVETVR